jgi:phosphoribosylformimino-5-aminoimidazole carboxamide ribotide isomerase
VILFPAIDLKDGQCVRLLRGDLDQATVFNDSPSGQAEIFRDQGFEWIHVVDLNGAFKGAPVNGAAVEKILGAVSLKIQLGGGIRTMETIEYWLARGVSRVVLGTAALRNPELVRQACVEFPGQVAVGIDARGGRVAVQGWAESTDRTALDLAREFEDSGVAAIIHTDIDRDGVLTGVNVKATAGLAAVLSTPVIASGGVASIADLHALLAVESSGVQGVIAGRAIYDGRLDPVEALALLAA